MAVYADVFLLRRFFLGVSRRRKGQAILLDCCEVFRGGGCVLVASCRWRGERRPVGLINCVEGFSTFAGRPLLNVHDIVVHEDFRRQGIARALLAHVEAMARQRGCCKLTLEVLEGNHGARRAYLDFGFEGYQLDPAMGQALFFEKKLG
mgnify:CR=1 FL=1